MLLATRSGVQGVLRATTLSMLFAIVHESAVGEAPAVAAERPKSFDGWVAAARQYADALTNADVLSDLNYELAYVQLHAGELADASATATRVTYPLKCVYLHTALADRYHRRGDEEACRGELEQARAVATATQESQTNNFLFSHLIRAYVETDMAEEAKAYAASLPPWVHRDLGLRELASALAKQGELEKALEIVQQEVSEKSRDVAFTEVALACARAGRDEDVQSLLPNVATAEQRDQVLAALAAALAEAGRISKAQKAADQITAAQARSEARSKVLAKWAEGTDPETIAARIKAAPTRDEKLGLSRKLVEKLTAEKRIDEAEAAIGAMISIVADDERPPLQSRFGEFGDEVVTAELMTQYLPVARLLHERGDTAGAKRRTVDVENAVVALPPEAGLAKMMLTVTLLDTQIKIGDLAGARLMVAGMEGEVCRQPTAGVLAAALAKQGNTEGALEVVGLMQKGERVQGVHLQGVVAELIRANEIAAARKVMDGVSGSTEVVLVYRAAGRAMLEARRSQQLHDWLPDMPSDVARAYACIGAAEGLKSPQLGS